MNENNYLPRTTNQNGLMNITIPEETLDLISSLADENALWVKTTDGGFLINDKVIPEIKGVIVNIKAYYVKWVEKRPEKIPFEGQPQPEGFELRCDLKIDVQGTVIGLSLPKTSTKTHLSQYLKFLKQSGLLPNHVITRARVKTVSSPHGKFNVVIFDAVGTVNDLQAAPASTDPAVIDVSVIAVAAPQPVQASSNPWA